LNNVFHNTKETIKTQKAKLLKEATLLPFPKLHKTTTKALVPKILGSTIDP